MNKARLEAFSDGVIAIIITIMVLELPLPHGGNWDALQSMLPGFGTYVLSFIFLGIYWNNHHHMLHTVTRVNGAILWANLHLLFWLSLVPFLTGWVDENHFAPLPVATYGVVLLFAAIGYSILENAIIRDQGRDSKLAAAIGKNIKGKASVMLYAAAIPLAFVNVWISCALYILVALMWLTPDRRIEKKFRE